VLPFASGLHGPFLLDDISNLDGARAATGSVGELVYAIIHNDTGLLRRPLANLSFLINYHWIGHDPFDYKLVNLILHWLNACLVWRLAAGVIGLLYPKRECRYREFCGLFIAALWEIHPIQVSSVLYIVQRMAEMSAFFILWALVVFLRLIQKPATKPFRDIALRTIGLGTIVILGVLSKENAVLFPCFLLAIYFAASESAQSSFVRDAPSKVLFALMTWIPIVLGLAIVIVGFQWLTAGYASREYTLYDRIFTEPFVLLRYLYTMLIPNIGNMGLYIDDMPLHHADEPFAWFLLLATFSVALGAIVWRRYAPALAFSILWFLSAHLLESTFLPLEIAFEHRNYLALFGPMFAFGYYFFGLMTASRINSLRLACTIPIAILAAGTTVRAHQWSDVRFFLEHEVANHPLSARAQNAAVELDIESGDIEKATSRVKTVQLLKPGVFWPLSLDFNLACDIPEHKVQWDKMLLHIEQKPSEASIMGMLQYDARMYLNSTCANVDPEIFDDFLMKVLNIYRVKNQPTKIEELLVLRSYIAKSKHQLQNAREILHAAAQANPDGVIALSDLAYLELNSDNLDDASAVIEQLADRVRRSSPSRQFEVDELRRYLSEAKTAQVR